MRATSFRVAEVVARASLSTWPARAHGHPWAATRLHPRAEDPAAEVRSAFAPDRVVIRCPWGEKALTGYLGEIVRLGAATTPMALIEDLALLADLLVDQYG